MSVWHSDTKNYKWFRHCWHPRISYAVTRHLITKWWFSPAFSLLDLTRTWPSPMWWIMLGLVLLFYKHFKRKKAPRFVARGQYTTNLQGSNKCPSLPPGSLIPVRFLYVHTCSTLMVSFELFTFSWHHCKRSSTSYCIISLFMGNVNEC